MSLTSDEYVLKLDNPQLQDLLSMRIHGSVIDALREVGALPHSPLLTEDDAPGLRNWAASTNNPSGQRAALARAIAELITVGNGARLERIVVPTHQVGFWDTASR